MEYLSALKLLMEGFTSYFVPFLSAILVAVGFYEKVIAKPKEGREEKRHKDMVKMIDVSNEEHRKLAEQNQRRLDYIEEVTEKITKQNYDHEGRLVVLEKTNGIHTFGYVKKEGD